MAFSSMFNEWFDYLVKTKPLKRSEKHKLRKLLKTRGEK